MFLSKSSFGRSRHGAKNFGQCNPPGDRFSYQSHPLEDPNTEQPIFGVVIYYEIDFRIKTFLWKIQTFGSPFGLIPVHLFVVQMKISINIANVDFAWSLQASRSRFGNHKMRITLGLKVLF